MLTDATPEFVTKLAMQLGAGAMRMVEPRDLEEPRGVFTGKAAAVFRPLTVGEVSTILATCNAARVGVVPLSGGTGLAGGQTLQDGAMPVILSLERMTTIIDISPENNSMTVQAGAILADVQTAAQNAGRLFPLSLASEGSCRIGGNLATNAGGVNVLRYGNMRDLCLGLEYVLADGTIVNTLKMLRKDNTGYDLRHLMIGSEGTLGVITSAILRLLPLPNFYETAMLAVPSPKAALALLTLLSDQLGGVISAFELIHRNGLDFLTEAGLPFTEPFSEPSEWMVLLDCADGMTIRDKVENALMAAMEAGLVSDAVLAQNEAQRQALWQIRETIPEANKRVGSVSSHDISVPVAQVPAFIEAAKQRIDPMFRINCFGHLGDGNLHYNIFPPKGKLRDEFIDLRPEISRSIYDLVADFGGSFSAEHGIGRLKVDDLKRYSDAGKLATMRAIKNALDPGGILNPGAILA
ncbi:MAG: FAD-binding oxidoreductase [Rhodobacteraceae bacterium]|nr:FAD-binding oxidoreductase [Paracoccaceae bacterium]